MALLALKALSIGSEKIPDKAFHTLSYFRPEGEETPIKFGRSKSKSDKKKKKKDAGKKMHDNSDSRSNDEDVRSQANSRKKEKSEDYSASESGNDTEESSRRRLSQRPTRRNRRYTSSQHLDRGYDSDGMTRDQYQQSRGIPPSWEPGTGPYFPPPPVQAYEDYPNERLESDRRFTGNDASYMKKDIYDRDSELSTQNSGLYSNRQTAAPPYQSNLSSVETEHPRPNTERLGNQYYMASSFAPSPQNQPQGSWEPRRNSINPGYTPHAGYAENFTSGHQPPQQQQYHMPDAQSYQAPYNMSAGPNGYATGGAYPTYVPPQDNWTPSRSPSRDSHRRGHRDRRSRSDRNIHDEERSRSRSIDSSRDHSRDRNRHRDDDRRKERRRSRSIAAQAKDALKSNRDVASSALGVVAGGLIGNQVGRGNRFGTLAGAVLGGFGANLWEKQHADKKEKRERRGHDGQVSRYRSHEVSRGRRYYDDHGYESD
ncbi:uncharacterized protein PV09_07745 [Verruconis gallopava]|uniref:Uncharacterized protein n=1 Tax=Verruconis gallopava TaxID=253628 RepID=A0A0D2ANP7_9PEZI|nr:uncharacterized protein PV09_07745 [Verruconis gallopava]KIW00764.1 hypothetical protein PV09_07745 [Verruconis gallopava]